MNQYYNRLNIFRKLIFLLIGLFSLPANAQVSFTSSNLPIIVINTNNQEIVDEPKIEAEMGIIYNSEGRRNTLGDAFNEYEGKIGIEIRGQSSQMFPMKSYSIELWDDEGGDREESIFGLPEESDWVLYAPYTDKTLMRNFLAYTLSNSLGHWAAHCRFTEVVLNGNYIGVYVFMERIKRDKGRVNIKKLEEEDTGGDALTGGYIFSIDKEADGWFSKFAFENKPGTFVQFTYVDPDKGDLVPEQERYLQSYVDSFETALATAGFADPEKGYRKYADEQSFIDYLIVNEVSRNIDAYRISSFFYKDRNSTDARIYAGPVWDYDLAFRNANYCNGSLTSGWAYDFNTICPNDFYQVPFWWGRLMEDSLFRQNLACRWKTLRQQTLSSERIFALVDSVNTLVAEAQQRHFTQWPVLGQYVWPNPQPIPATYAGEISTLKSWLTQRLAWLDANMPKSAACEPWPEGAEGTMILSIPNPVQSFAAAVIRSKAEQQITVRIADAMGRIVLSETLAAQPGDNAIPNVSSFAPEGHGIYIIQLSNDKGEKIVRKLIY